MSESPARPEAEYEAGPIEPESEEARERGPHRWRRRLAVVLGVVVATAVAVFVLQQTVLSTFTISPGSTSMEPTLQPGDRILALRMGFTPKEGDIVVFKPPPTAVRDTDHRDLVKRIIGMPGDAVWSVGNTIYVNGHKLKGSWLVPNEPIGPPIGYQVVPKGQYFMLGDNLAPSYDSRYWGTVPRSDIVAKVECVVWQRGPDLRCF